MEMRTGTLALVLLLAGCTPQSPPAETKTSSDTIATTTPAMPAPPDSLHPDVRLTSPRPGDLVTSPLVVRGEARRWYFEGSFPFSLYDGDGNALAHKYVTAQGDWMTTEFVPFEGSVEFTPPATGGLGLLVLRKDNPSDQRELDDSLVVSVRFAAP